MVTLASEKHICKQADLGKYLTISAIDDCCHKKIVNGKEKTSSLRDRVMSLMICR